MDSLRLSTHRRHRTCSIPKMCVGSSQIDCLTNRLSKTSLSSPKAVNQVASQDRIEKSNFVSTSNDRIPKHSLPTYRDRVQPSMLIDGRHKKALESKQLVQLSDSGVKVAIYTGKSDSQLCIFDTIGYDLPTLPQALSQDKNCSQSSKGLSNSHSSALPCPQAFHFASPNWATSLRVERLLGSGKYGQVFSVASSMKNKSSGQNLLQHLTSPDSSKFAVKWMTHKLSFNIERDAYLYMQKKQREKCNTQASETDKKTKDASSKFALCQGRCLSSPTTGSSNVTSLDRLRMGLSRITRGKLGQPNSPNTGGTTSCSDNSVIKNSVNETQEEFSKSDRLHPFIIELYGHSSMRVYNSLAMDASSSSGSSSEDKTAVVNTTSNRQRITSCSFNSDSQNITTKNRENVSHGEAGASASVEAYTLLTEYAPGGDLGQLAFTYLTFGRKSMQLLQSTTPKYDAYARISSLPLPLSNAERYRYTTEFGGTMTPREAIFYVAELTEALIWLHDLGVVHQDIKPDNIMLSASGHIRLGDFGLACTRGRGIPFRGNIISTSRHLPPEISRHAAGTTFVWHAADWFSVGVLFYRLVCGSKNWPEPTTTISGPAKTDFSSIAANGQKKANEPAGKRDFIGFPGTPMCIDFVRRLLETQPEHRLGGCKYFGGKNVLAHPALLELLLPSSSSPTATGQALPSYLVQSIRHCIKQHKQSAVRFTDTKMGPIETPPIWLDDLREAIRQQKLIPPFAIRAKREYRSTENLKHELKNENKSNSLTRNVEYSIQRNILRSSEQGAY